ncbi:aminotransferase class IV [Pusillimonas sp. SM2304]|uniref:aminotransferase class IV n=1 Tax=Pusillimonas sp. SM2304 TaxID=3073241 RepID=UPI00287456AB|nr:aminotransferase class IV [Pusillimonas sp. SM2304]MDS1140695.1 aminotransferase class IV [Pusillimonas sp. SM2304]
MTERKDIQLIETIRVEPGRRLPLLAGHQARLAASCRALDYAPPGEALSAALRQQLDALNAAHAHRLRLLVNRDGSFSLTADPLPPTRQPVRLTLHPDALQADAFWLRHKTTRRHWYDETQQWLAHHTDYFDVVFCNAQDQVCEGSRSNVYIQDANSRWLTPPLSCGLLPGVQRQALLDQGLAREAAISRRDLLDAPAVRVSNALRGWLDAELA